MRNGFLLSACPPTKHPSRMGLRPSKICWLLLVGAEAGLQAAVLLDQDHVLLRGPRTLGGTGVGGGGGGYGMFFARLGSR